MRQLQGVSMTEERRSGSLPGQERARMAAQGRK